MLHITNGDSVTTTLAQTGLGGQFLAWRDPLHDGPVPHRATLAELSDIRARTLSGFGWATYEELRKDFAERDRVLEAFRDHDEVVLWFEHDLYDQLQLLQILAWFNDTDQTGTKLSLIELDSHPEVLPFYGLGQLNAAQLEALWPSRAPVSPKRLADAAKRWAIFTSASHENLTGLDRLLEEYPGTDGLSRLERQLLLAAAKGAATAGDLYRGSQRFEDVPWGDSSVFLRLHDLASGPAPALESYEPDSFRLTKTGRAILRGQLDWIQARGGADRWLGGVHLTGLNPAWRWDSETCLLTPQTR